MFCRRVLHAGSPLTNSEFQDVPLANVISPGEILQALRFCNPAVCVCVCVCVCVGACVGVVCACVCVWVCCPIHFSLLGFGNIRSLSSDAYCMAGTAAALYDDVRVTS